MFQLMRCTVLILAWGLVAECAERTPEWEAAKPVVPIPEPPLGIDASFADLEEPPTPERVRLGRWFFYDTRFGRQKQAELA